MALQSHTSQVQRFRLISSRLRDFPGKVFASYLSETRVCTLVLDSVELTDDLGCEFARRLVGSNVSCLSMSGCGINCAVAVEVAASMIRPECNLTHLDLSWNYLAEEALCALADAVQQENNTLRSLITTDNVFPLEALQQSGLDRALRHPNCKLRSFNEGRADLLVYTREQMTTHNMCIADNVLVLLRPRVLQNRHAYARTAMRSFPVELLRLAAELLEEFLTEEDLEWYE
jgi:hypothetical protein